MNIKQSFLALCFVLGACGGGQPGDGDGNELASAESAFTALSRSDVFIRQVGMNDELCYSTSSGVSCVSGDRRSPLAVGHAVPDDLYLCAQTSRGTLTGCQPDVQEYYCTLGGCHCLDYSDCVQMAIEQDCTVSVIPCSGCPKVTGSCTPGQ